MKHPFFFLSESFSYPETDTLAEKSRALVLLAQDLGLDVPVAEEISAIPFIDLQAEYVRLFINSADGVFAPPYASIYVNDAGILHQQGYDDALSFYARAEMAPAETTESPDHIAHELAFVGLLLDAENNKLLAGFLSGHLCVWYSGFLQRLQDAQANSFYSVLGQVTNLCLTHLQKEVVHE